MKKLVDLKYQTLSDSYKRKMTFVKHVSITCDVWSETMTMTSFLGVTAHYIER